MSDFTKRYLITIILLSVTAFATLGAYSRRSYVGKLCTQDIPMIIGDWYGKDLPVDKRTYDILETRDVLMREYVNSSNEEVILTVVYTPSNRKVSHPPEVCFVGSGWSTIDEDLQETAIDGQNLALNRLILQRDSEKQIVLYLYKAGEKLTPNYRVQQASIVLNGMLRRNVSSALIRISASASDGHVERVTARMMDFAVDTIPIVAGYLP